MSDLDQDIKRHVTELVRLTMFAADATEPLPEDELARLGMLIATERQLLIDGISLWLAEEEPDEAASPGVAEFDAGFCYGLEFARAIDDTRVAIEGVRRGRLLKLVRPRVG